MELNYCSCGDDGVKVTADATRAKSTQDAPKGDQQ